MEVFGCCSSYEKCSDAMKCLHVGDVDYEGCRYRMNLEAGRIFYGQNPGEGVSKATGSVVKKEYFIYLACYNELFVVYVKSKRAAYSYNLDHEQFEKVTGEFDRLSIPYRTELDKSQGVDISDIVGDAPSNSRVYFKLGDEGFYIYYFNSYLMKEYYADKICKAFQAKGIESRVECIESGKQSTKNVSKHVDKIVVPKQKSVDKPEKKDTASMVLGYAPGSVVQVSIFEYMRTLKPATMQDAS